MFRRIKKGQSTLEYTILLIIVMGAFLGVSNYFKRGVQGRWKSAVDDFGDQYDPRATNSWIRHVISSNSVMPCFLIAEMGTTTVFPPQSSGERSESQFVSRMLRASSMPSLARCDAVSLVAPIA